MSGSGPLTARQFAIILWGPVLVLLGIGGTYRLFADQQPEQQRERRSEQQLVDQCSTTSAEQLEKERQELHRNLEGVKQQQNHSGH